MTEPLAGLLALWGGVLIVALGHWHVRNPRPPATLVRTERGRLSRRRRRHVQSAGSAMMGVGVATALVGLALLFV